MEFQSSAATHTKGIPPDGRISESKATPNGTAISRGLQSGNWALLASIVATCKLSDVNLVAYIAATLEAIFNGHPQSGIEDVNRTELSPTGLEKIAPLLDAVLPPYTSIYACIER